MAARAAGGSDGRHSTEPRSCARSPTGACTIAAKGRIENTAPAFLAAIAQGLRHRVRPAGGQGRHADGLPRRQARSAHRARRGASPPHARQPRAPALQGPGRRTSSPSPSFLDLVGGRVPLLVEVKTNAPRRCTRFSTGSPARRGPTKARSRSCPSISTSSPRWPSWPRPSRAGPWSAATAPPDWWAAPRAAGSATIARLLNRTPPGSGFLAVDVKMLRATRAWMTRHAIDLPLFSWTIRTGASALRPPGGPMRRSSRATRRESGVRPLAETSHRLANVRARGLTPCRHLSSPRSPLSVPR